ncbi:hypothetical protein BKA62DRAFT_826145 [Auriculariales sp. MPI-PUGE-AT-0066]|nr:hypothetical protein BKA62DRAFT_826145 [Auriculariales sp. MPI-PUGE-AT-0066]
MSLLPMQIRIEEDDGSARTLDVVDLYDLALIMTYERYTIEPRFRHTQLYDYASNRNDFSVLRIAAGNDWYNPAKINKRIGFFFQPEPDAPHHESERDLPSKMLPWNIADGPPLLKSLTPTELDTIFWQARAHDSCYASIALLQFLFKLFSPDQPLRIRTGDGTEFISLIRQMHTARYDIFDLRQMIFSIVKRDQEQSEGGYYTGESEQMPHCVAAFPPWVAIRGRGQVERTILDLSSLQFGDAGRGLKGHKSLFVFESITKFEERMKVFQKAGERMAPCSVEKCFRDLSRNGWRMSRSGSRSDTTNIRTGPAGAATVARLKALQRIHQHHYERALPANLHGIAMQLTKARHGLITSIGEICVSTKEVSSGYCINGSKKTL